MSRGCGALSQRLKAKRRVCWEGTLLHTWAESVLHGTRIEDKLLAPPEGVDGAWVAQRGPSWPGRPRDLRLDAPRPPVAFPSLRDLERDHTRGVVLHFFANHELLALELMALALLRFPDAPTELRRGLVRIMVDEQRHMQLYLDRMGALGVGLGDVPVNAFFWNALSGSATIEELLAGLSLVFEQANLDFAARYAEAFRVVGDRETEAVLDRIFEDEIRHVEHGLTWLRRMKDPALSDWEAFRGLLRLPLTPARAKSAPMALDARRRAGFDEDFVSRLRVYSHSQGRPPMVWWPNANAEMEVVGRALSAHHVAANDDLAPLTLLLAAPHDTVLLPREPALDHLLALRDAGVELPEVVPAPRPTPRHLDDRPIEALRPWALTPPAATALEPLRAAVRTGPPTLWMPGWGALFDKRTALALGRDLAPGLSMGIEASSAQAVEAFPRPCLVKAPYSTAGQDRLRLRGPMRENERGWLNKVLAAHGSVVVQPWMQRVLDLSLQADLGPQGLVLRGTRRFLTNARGQYRGTLLAPLHAGLSPELRRWFADDGHDRTHVTRRLEQAMERVAEHAASLGYAGPLAIDAMVVRQGDRFALVPLLEINPRITLTRLADGLAPRIARRAVAVHLVVPLRALHQAGLDATVLAKALAQQWPLQRDQGVLCSGALFTTPPQQARALLTFALIEAHTHTLVQRWAQTAESLGVTGLTAWLDGVHLDSTAG